MPGLDDFQWDDEDFQLTDEQEESLARLNTDVSEGKQPSVEDAAVVGGMAERMRWLLRGALKRLTLAEREVRRGR